MIRVLMVLGGSMGFGGTEAFLMNYYRHIDRSRIQFDFVFQGPDPGVYDDEITDYGGIIYHVPFKRSHPIRFDKQLKNIIKQGQYKIVHGHMDAMNAWVMWTAKRSGVPVRISHSHSTDIQSSNFVKRFINNAVKKLISYFATDLWACSLKAGEWLYGKELAARGKVKIIHNAIDSQLFSFDPVLREKIRRSYGISDQAFVVGHIGRLSYMKNHQLLLQAFSDLCGKEKETVLLLVGDGELRGDLEKQVKELNIEDKVIFVGNQRNSYEFYNAMDIFVFPSLFEGLGITFLEAQVNGLFCICSYGVTKEGCISSVKYLGLDDPAELWSDTIRANKGRGRSNNIPALIEKGYDINNEAKKLTEQYEKLLSPYDKIGEQI